MRQLLSQGIVKLLIHLQKNVNIEQSARIQSTFSCTILKILMSYHIIGKYFFFHFTLLYKSMKYTHSNIFKFKYAILRKNIQEKYIFFNNRKLRCG